MYSLDIPDEIDQERRRFLGIAGWLSEPLSSV